MYKTQHSWSILEVEMLKKCTPLWRETHLEVKMSQSQVRFNRICGHLTHGNPAEAFPALGFAARFRKTCENKTLRPLGIPPKLILDLSSGVIKERNWIFWCKWRCIAGKKQEPDGGVSSKPRWVSGGGNLCLVKGGRSARWVSLQQLWGCNGIWWDIDMGYNGIYSSQRFNRLPLLFIFRMWPAELPHRHLPNNYIVAGVGDASPFLLM